jgi:hypothetical protein
MTRRAFTLWVGVITVLYSTFILVGIVLFDDGTKDGGSQYALFKDCIPLATALPAAILTGVYQNRSSFIQQLRATWSVLVPAVQDAIQFTHLTNPKPEDFAAVMKVLSVSIEDFRSLYKNLKETPSEIGFYPFESLKKIQAELSQYYLNKPEDRSEARRKQVRDSVTKLWKVVRKPILSEFDRLSPTYFDSPFVDGLGNVAQQSLPADAPSAASRRQGLG